MLDVLDIPAEFTTRVCDTDFGSINKNGGLVNALLGFSVNRFPDDSDTINGESIGS